VKQRIASCGVSRCRRRPEPVNPGVSGIGDHCESIELAARVAAGVTASVAAGTGGYTPGRLHQGEPGIAVLAADLTRLEIASMPFFASVR
jgi:hypothetical protein